MENYNKIYNEVKKSEELDRSTETVQPFETEQLFESVQPVETENPVETEQPVVRKMGIVTECAKLNVREEPYADANILCTINLATEVEIDELESTEDFYKIYTASGIEGFCMKQFIAV